jgi:acyl-CoA hydrolase
LYGHILEWQLVGRNLDPLANTHDDPAAQPMPHTLTRETMARWLHGRSRVYWPGCAGHSPLFESWFRAAPELAAGRWFCGVWIPGVNRFDPTAWHAETRAASIFVAPEWRAAWQRGALDHLPLSYPEMARYLATPGRFEVALLQLAPPDEQGLCSLSVTADFAPAVLQGLSADAVVLAHINPRLPRTRGPSVPVQRINAWVHADTPPLLVAEEPADAALAAVAQQVATLVRDADVLQLGLGKLQAAVLAALSSHRQLRVHAGMVSEGLLGLMQHGALAPLSLERPPVCTGVALGSEALYAAMADAALVQFAPVGHTHAHNTLAAIDKLVSINSALAIDLFGQVNVETLHGRQVSGVGGLADFARGARASSGGRAIVAATARAGRGGSSRFTTHLPDGLVGLGRADVDLVVTEYGAADVRHLGVDARAQALIGIAAPEHRAALDNDWHTLRRSL